MSNHRKMYILIREGIPAGFAILGAAHASLACFLKYKAHEETGEWVSGPFHKAVCRVDDREFERAKAFEDHVVITESALEGEEVAIAFRPRTEWPKFFRFLKLYK